MRCMGCCLSSCFPLGLLLLCWCAGTSWSIPRAVMFATTSHCFSAWQTTTSCYQVITKTCSICALLKDGGCSSQLCCCSHAVVTQPPQQHHGQGCETSQKPQHNVFAGVAGWSHFAQFTIAVVNKDPKKSKYSGKPATTAGFTAMRDSQ